MIEFAPALQKWPTLEWALGEIEIYAIASLACGAAFLLVAGLLFLTAWTLSAIGLLVCGAAGGAIALKLIKPSRVFFAFPRIALRPAYKARSMKDTERRAAESPSDLDEFGDDLQRLMDSAERIAAENEALRADLAQLHRRALRRRSNLTS